MATRPQRRTQAQRSDAMRRRLMKATLECLATEGYAGTTVSAVVKRAGVSRGAHLHHYQTKEALITDAAEDLLRRTYRKLGDVMLDSADEEHRLPTLMRAIWEQVFDSRMYRAFIELLLASRHEPALAAALQRMVRNTIGQLDIPVRHYFVPRGGKAEDATEMFLMTFMVYTGLAAGGHLAARGEEDVDRLIDLWTRLMAAQMRPRRGVRTPPPRPADWPRADES